MIEKDQEIVEIIKEHLKDVHTIYLYGSRASHAHFSEESDWDFAILSENFEGFDPIELWELQNEITAQLDICVDLVDFRNVSTLLQYEVLKASKMLWSKDEAYAQLIESKFLGEYQLFSESQEAIMTDIVKRGSVYGA